jgi:phospholipid N-methyltransferase
MSFAIFARNAIADYRSTAAIVPSSQHLANAMVEPLRSRPLRVVVEFGPGTGVITRELLRAMPDKGNLLAFEISPRFVAYLRKTRKDKRLQIVQAGAETAVAELTRRGIDQVDAVVSSLGVSIMDIELVDAIFRPLLPRLGRHGVVTQFQYVHRTRVHGGRVEYFNLSNFMERYFRSVRSNCVLMNLPPAHVITCSGARTGDLRP